MNILLTHYVDLDGLAPIVLSKYFNLSIGEYLPLLYDEEKDENGRYILEDYVGKVEKIFITDFGISKGFFEFIDKNFGDYYIFDHHEASLELPKRDTIFVDIKKSGTLLFYEWIKKNYNFRIPKIIEQYVNITNTYDTWNKESPLWPEAENLNRVLWKCIDYQAKDKTFDRFMPFINLQLDKLKKGKKWYWTNYEHQLIQEGIAKEQQELQSAEDNIKIRNDSKGYKFALYHGSSKISQVCSMLLEKYEELTYIININTFQMGSPKAVNGKISVRAKEGFDVTKFSGVNGHKLAGGGKFPEKYLVNLWTGTINQIPYINERG